MISSTVEPGIVSKLRIFATAAGFIILVHSFLPVFRLMCGRFWSYVFEKSYYMDPNFNTFPARWKPRGFVSMLGDMQDESRVCWDLYSKGSCGRDAWPTSSPTGSPKGMEVRGFHNFCYKNVILYTSVFIRMWNLRVLRPPDPL